MNKKINSNLFFAKTFDFLELYLPHQLSRSNHTIKSYKDSLSIFRKYLLEETKTPIKKFKFTDCTNECLLKFIGYLKERKVSNATINNRITAIKNYMWYAADIDITLQQQALSLKRITLMKQPQKEKKILNNEQLRLLFQQPPATKIGNRDRLIMILLYDTAVRVSELLSIRLKDLMYNTNEPYVLIQGKGNKERVVAINSKTISHLKLYISVWHDKNPSKEDLLFYTIIKGIKGAMTTRNVERILKKYSSEIENMPSSVHPHMLRRTRATTLYQSNVQLELVSRILGHSQIETTRIYATPSMEQMREALKTDKTLQNTTEDPEWTKLSEDEIAKLCGIR